MADTPDTTKVWNSSTDNVYLQFKSSKLGLSESETNERIAEYGENSIGGQKPKSAISLLTYQFKNWLVLMLLGASGVSFFLGESLDGLVIILLVSLSVFLGFIQEYKAEKAIFGLKKLITRESRALRDGKWKKIDSKLLVPGDIVEIRIGDKVPADIRLTSVDNLAVDESALTGESISVQKVTNKLSETSENPSKLTNMAFLGTSVSEGRGIGVVVSTGSNTVFGKSAKSLETPEPETDFQKQIKNFSLFLFKVVMVMTLFIFAINATMQKNILDSFLFALALAVGITPEMLPAIITITLSEGALKMAKKKVVVKRLISVEDFGNVDTFCTDKTGTLTEGKFVLDSYVNLDGEKDDNVLVAASLCTSGFFEKTQEVLSSQVDTAILQSNFVKAIAQKLSEYRLLDENVFDFVRKRMSVLVDNQGKKLILVKGAYENVIDVSSYALIKGKKVKIASVKKKISDLIDNFESKSFRVIAVAGKNHDGNKSGVEDEKGMTLYGFVLFKDPVKPSCREAIKKFEELGVKLKVLSGDSVAVSVNVAKEAGFVFNENQVISGDELDAIDESKFREVCLGKTIFARVTPEQKYKIVNALNFEGHIVGYMGDGVNDVAALRAADVGISVDSGVDIAKDASDIILLQKDLGILSEGIKSGRKTFGNIMKYIVNTISANYGNMFTVAVSSLFIKFIPLLPSQILLNNFISDIPLFAVATDNVDKNFLQKPKRWNLSYIKSFMINYGFVSSFFDMMLILPMLFILKVSPEVFRTAWFVESSISEMLITFTIRTKMPFYKSKPSPWLLWLSIGSIAVVGSMPFTRFRVFEFESLPLSVWGLILFDLIAYFAVTEVVKKGFFKRFESTEK